MLDGLRIASQDHHAGVFASRQRPLRNHFGGQMVVVIRKPRVHGLMRNIAILAVRPTDMLSVVFKSAGNMPIAHTGWKPMFRKKFAAVRKTLDDRPECK